MTDRQETGRQTADR